MPRMATESRGRWALGDWVGAGVSRRVAWSWLGLEPDTSPCLPPQFPPLPPASKHLRFLLPLSIFFLPAFLASKVFCLNGFVLRY